MIEAIPRIDVSRIREAQERISGLAIRTPLVPLNAAVASGQVYLKLENLQPIGSFKLRGALNAMLQIPRDELEDGRGGVGAAAHDVGRGDDREGARLGQGRRGS